MSRIKDYLMDIEEGRIVPGDLEDKYVCSEHFLDNELQGVIKQEGHRGRCSYCGEKRIVMNMPDFVRMVREKNGVRVRGCGQCDASIGENCI